MPALTKKKKPSHRTSTGRRASGTGRAKKGRTGDIYDEMGSTLSDVKAYVSRNKGVLKKLGWVLAPGAMAAGKVREAQAEKKKSDAARKTSKGGRGTERENKGKGRKR